MAAETGDDTLLTEEEQERVKDVRAKMYWIYKPKTVSEFKVATCVPEAAVFQKSVESPLEQDYDAILANWRPKCGSCRKYVQGVH
jgi:hypothetical protein